MTVKNSVFTVTPPDLRLSPNGPCIMLLGVVMADATPYTDMYEKLFPEVEVTFFVSDDGFTEDTAPWFRATSSMASNIIVNLDSATIEELFLATEAEKDPAKLVFWMSKDRPVIVSLLSSYHYQIFTSLEEIEQMLVAEFSKSS
jgi:hypothetical protein